MKKINFKFVFGNVLVFWPIVSMISAAIYLYWPILVDAFITNIEQIKFCAYVIIFWGIVFLSIGLGTKYLCEVGISKYEDK